jgi:hypothetical protein
VNNFSAASKGKPAKKNKRDTSRYHNTVKSQALQSNKKVGKYKNGPTGKVNI